MDSTIQTLPAGTYVYKLESGRVQKTTPKVTVSFQNPFAAAPNVVIAPHWEGREQGLGAIEHIFHIDHASFTIWGANHAPEGFYVQWIAYGLMSPHE